MELPTVFISLRLISLNINEDGSYKFVINAPKENEVKILYCYNCYPDDSLMTPKGSFSISTFGFKDRVTVELHCDNSEITFPLWTGIYIPDLAPIEKSAKRNIWQIARSGRSKDLRYYFVVKHGNDVSRTESFYWWTNQPKRLKNINSFINRLTKNIIPEQQASTFKVIINNRDVIKGKRPSNDAGEESEYVPPKTKIQRLNETKEREILFLREENRKLISMVLDLQKRLDIKPKEVIPAFVIEPYPLDVSEGQDINDLMNEGGSPEELLTFCTEK